MLENLKMQLNTALTENGAKSYATTTSYCVDLFATIGALRHSDDIEIKERFLKAFAENADIAMKILFYARDVRGGLGERRVFRLILEWLCFNEPKTVLKNVSFIAEYGRFDDLLVLINTPCEDAAIDLIKSQLFADINRIDSDNNAEISLLAKWLPSVNTSNKQAVKLAKHIAKRLGMTESQYRKTLVALRARIKIIENNLRQRNYTFDYSKQPSKALFKYRKSFIRNDRQRYDDFIEGVQSGNFMLKTGAITPYEIINPFFRGCPTEEERKAINVTWNAQRDYTNGENALVVIDGSGSMYYSGNPIPAAVALSLGIYYAERNKGTFRNHFITFSENPQLVEIKGQDIYEKFRFCHTFNEIANTNIKKVFELILATALKHNTPAEQMPSTIYIISDMEFDSCADDADVTNFEYAKRIYTENGYNLPKVVFWNVDSRTKQQPVTKNEQGVALVSGCTPRIFSLLSSGKLDPEGYMLAVISSERYAAITA